MAHQGKPDCVPRHQLQAAGAAAAAMLPCCHAATLPQLSPPEGMTSLRLPPSLMAGMPSPPRMPSSQPLITSCTPTWGSRGGRATGEGDGGLKLGLQQASGMQPGQSRGHTARLLQLCVRAGVHHVDIYTMAAGGATGSHW